MKLPRQVAAVCLDAFLLARFAPSGSTGRPDGRAWERAVSGMLWRPGLPRRQHAGTIGLWGMDGASGAAHEIDGAGHGPSTAVWIEAKGRAALDKADVALFELKCNDFYRGAARAHPAATSTAAWWPLLVSSEPVGEAVHRLCLGRGIVLCEPEHLPLPVLLRAAANPEADLHLPETLLSEAVRLFERPCAPMQERWPITAGGRDLTISLADDPDAGDIADALYIQRELGEELLDYFEVEAPGQLERRAGELNLRLERVARAA